MTGTYIAPIDNDLDLILERHIDAPKNLVWRALTEPELIKQWFCPKPWATVDCRVDLRVGGEFYTVMQSPEGDKFPGASCFLEIVPQERIIWTAALKPGFRPAPPFSKDDKACAEIIFTCVVTLKDTTNGTQYTAHVMHGNAQQTKMHEEMGFHEGWGTALNQMVDVIKTL